MNVQNLLTTQDVAERINKTQQRVIQMINEGKLKATRIGRDFLITEDDLSRIQLTRPTGRPKKDEQ